MGKGMDSEQNSLSALLRADKGNATLGKHVADVTKKWFKEKDPISKLAIAYRYCAWLETITGANQMVNIPDALEKLMVA